VLKQLWKNTTAGEKFVVLGAAVTVAAWLLGVGVNGIWWDVSGAQTMGLLAALVAVVAAVVVYFNVTSGGAVPANEGLTLVAVSAIAIVFVAIATWSVFSLNSSMGTLNDCVKGGASSAACQKVNNLSINDFLNQLKLVIDNAGYGQKSVTTGMTHVSTLLSPGSSKATVPALPISTWIAAAGLILGAACMAWGSFQEWTTSRALARAS
jgi:hypothetical protein